MTANNTTGPSKSKPTSWVEKIEKNKNLIWLAIGVVLVAGVVMFFRDRGLTAKDRTANGALAKVTKSYKDKKKNFGVDDDPMAFLKKPEEAGKEDSNKIKKTGDLNQDYGDVVSGFQSIISKYSSHTVSVEAAVSLSEIFMEYDKFDQAINILDKVKSSFKSNNILKGLLMMTLGNVFQKSGDCNKAVDVWSQVVNMAPVKVLHAEAALRSGLCLEQVDKKDKAIEMYRKASLIEGDSMASKAASKFLRVLQLETGTK